MDNKRELNFIDIFAGAGGLSEGFLRAGMHAVAHIEMNAHACKTLQTRSCYYYLKDNDKLDIYDSYLRGAISREDFYGLIPQCVLDTVIEQTMTAATMPKLYKKIDELMDAQSVKKIDLLVGGPPCQAYSLVGRARSADGMENDPRNYLYKLYCNVLNRYKPEMFVFENVPGLLSANEGQYLKDMLKQFSQNGYVCELKVLNARNFGVLQNRRRVILIGWNKASETKHFYPDLPESYSDNYIVDDVLEDLPELQPGDEKRKYSKGSNAYLQRTEIRTERDLLTWHVARNVRKIDREIYRLQIDAWNNDCKRLKYTELPKKLQTHNNKSSFLDRFKVVAGDLPASQTMVAHISKDGHYFIHPSYKQGRSLSVREAARLQSFPDNFFFEGPRTSAFLQIGNAVPPLMAYKIAKEIKKQLQIIGENKHEAPGFL